VGLLRREQSHFLKIAYNPGNKVEKILAIKQLCQKQDLQLSDLNIVVAHSKWMEFGDRKEKLHMVKVIKCDCANEYFYVWAEKTDLQDGQK